MFKDTKIALTGFMGVGKSSVARHLAHVMKCRWIDLDKIIEENAGRVVADIIDQDGIEFYRTLESQNLELVLNETDSHILSLGGGTWTVPANRQLLKAPGFTSVWPQSSYQHCCSNITLPPNDPTTSSSNNGHPAPRRGRAQPAGRGPRRLPQDDGGGPHQPEFRHQ